MKVIKGNILLNKNAQKPNKMQRIKKLKESSTVKLL